MTTTRLPTAVLGECQQCSSVFVRWNAVSFCTNPECPCGNPLPVEADTRFRAVAEKIRVVYAPEGVRLRLDQTETLYAVELAVRRDSRDDPEFVGERFVSSPSRSKAPFVPSIRDAKWMTNPIDTARLAARVGGRPWAVQFGPVIL